MQANGTESDGTTAYSLKYSTDGSTFKDVPEDDVTGAKKNSVDVYLIYKQQPHITVHYVDGAGNRLDDAETKYLSTISGEINLGSESTNNNFVKGISNYTYDSAHLKDYLGETVYSIKSTGSNNDAKLQVKYKSNGEYTDSSATDLYLVYNRTDAKKVEVYYTDIAGVPIRDESGNPIKKTYDPREWQNGTHDFTTDAESYTPDGYAKFVKSNINAADDIPNWWDGNRANHNDGNNTQNRILYVTDGIVNSASNRFGVEILRSVRGYQFDTMSYKNNTLSISRSSSYGGGGKSATAIPDDEKNSSPYKVYLLYRPLVKIHDVDTNGKSLGNVRTGDWSVGYYAKNRWSGSSLDSALNNWNNTLNSYSASSLSSNSKFGSRKSVYVKYKDSDGEEKKIEVQTSADTNNFKISWQFDGPQNWTTGNTSSAILNDNKETRYAYHWVTRIYKNADCSDYEDINGLVTDVYMEYDYTEPLNVTIHHVDSNGTKLAEDTTKNINASDGSLTVNDFQRSDITNYIGDSIQYGKDFKSDSTKASSIKFTKSNGNWQYTLENGTPINIENKAEVYILYKEKTDGRSVVVHYVDNNGKEIAEPVITNFVVSSSNNAYKNQWDGGNITGRGDTLAGAKKVPSGYTFVGEYLGPEFNTTEQKLVNNVLPSSASNRSVTKNAVQWRYESNNSDESKNGWYTSHGSVAKTEHNLSDSGVFHEYITDIYWVFSKDNINRDNSLTQHYGYMSNGDNNTTVFNAFTDLASSKYPSSIDGVSQSEVSVVPEYTTITTGTGENSKTYTYSGTYLATPSDSTGTNTGYNRLETDAPHVTKVRLKNEKLQYLTEGVEDVKLSLARRNRWMYTDSSGRRFTLKKEGSNYSIIDSLAGNSALDLDLTSSSGNTFTYKVSTSAEGNGSEYTVVLNKSNGTSSYKLSVAEWIENNQSHLYHVYTESTSSNIWIDNDVVNSGHLIAKGVPDGATDFTYTWLKSINNGEFEEVTRKQAGNDWNIDHDLDKRTWLDLVADDGEMSTESGRTSVRYKVKASYTYDGKSVNAESSVFNVPYYDQLENGSFETPAYSDANKTSSYSTNKKYFDGTFYSNEYYRSLGGVWQTTGLGKYNAGGNSNGKDIEIVNTKDSGYLSSYGWPNGSKEGASNGEQFAELNAEYAGALYQDVATHSNTYLNYWLSHRARGQEGRPSASTYHYDTMYLVIMPTSLAMKSGSNGSELTNQSDLQNFINSHGGYESSGNGNTHTKEENKVIYRNDKTGILVARITSDNHDWHKISVANGYIAKSNLTRFFFVAGPTAYHGSTADRNITIGNMLDDVGFSQKLPTPETPHFHMVVTKTFSGLSSSEVADLASNKATDGKQFKFTIDEYENAELNNKSDSYSETDDSGDTQTSLNDAVLGFTSDTNGNFTLTAKTHNGTNLFTDGGSSTGVVSEDPYTGDITMTWTLYNNYIPPKGTKYFKILESGSDIDGYSVATNNHGTVDHGASTAKDKSTSIAAKSGNDTNAITVVDQDTARINYSNSYQNNANDDPNQITVEKKFTGITPVTVASLTGGSNPFKITVTNPSSQPITLTGNAENPIDGDLPDGVTNVELKSETSNDDGSTTLTWTITGTNGTDNWAKNGKYAVTENNFTVSHDNPISGISINEDDITDKINPSKTDISVGENGSAPTVQISDSNSLKSITSGKSETVDAQTNLIIASYTVNNGTRYFVWTPDIANLNLKQSILKLIKDKFGGTIDVNNVKFRSGDNPGKIELKTNETEEQTPGNINYDSSSHQLSFTNSTNSNGVQWTSYLSCYYTINETDKNKITEIRIKNKYEPVMRIQKVDADHQSTLLGGAEFKLYRLEGQDKKYYQKSENETSASWNADEESANKFTTSSNDDDKGIVQLPELKDSETYYLEESKAPDGYNRLTKPIAFKVNEDGSVEQAESTTDAETPKPDWNSPYYTITISNRAGFVLPWTGGSGTTAIYIAGALLVSIAIILYKKRREHQTDDR